MEVSALFLDTVRSVFTFFLQVPFFLVVHCYLRLCGTLRSCHLAARAAAFFRGKSHAQQRSGTTAESVLVVMGRYGFVCGTEVHGIWAKQGNLLVYPGQGTSSQWPEGTFFLQCAQDVECLGQAEVQKFRVIVN